MRTLDNASGDFAVRHDAGASPRSRTRERVLEVSLALFNARGLERVTTAEIAAAAGINEGNLYYYFRKKEQLAAALFERFGDALIATAESPLSDPADPASYAAYNRGWFALMWDWRVFYRDGGALRLMAPSLRQRLAELTVRSQAEVARVFRTMRAHGFLAIDDADIDGLISNIWIVSSYWMDYRLQTAAELSPVDLAWGLRQVELLVRPYLTRPDMPAAADEVVRRVSGA